MNYEQIRANQTKLTNQVMKYQVQANRFERKHLNAMNGEEQK